MAASSKILGLALVGAGLLVLGIASLTLLPGRSSSAAENQLHAVPQSVHFPAPDLKLTGLDGQPVALADLRGQVVLVNNWATWCPPCRAEMPVLEAYYLEHRGQNFVLVGIDASESSAEVADFVDQYDLSFPIWLDPNNEALRGFYNAALPNSYVIDAEGQVVLGWTGGISRQLLEAHVTPLLEN